MKKEIKILIVIGLLFSTVQLPVVAQGIGDLIGRSEAGMELRLNVVELAIWAAKRVLYINRGIAYGTEGLDEFKENISDIVLMNPPVEELFNLMGIVMELVFAFYIPVIAFLGFYLLFLSSSPEGRAKAKGMLTRLVIGLVLVSLSPQLINILLDISEALASSILAITGKEIFTGAWDEAIGGPLSGLIRLHWMATFIEIELGFYTFLFFMILVWGAFIFPIIIRFFVVSTFIVLFPLAIFLYSFEFSRALGRMMMEQTLIWTFLQVINALIVLTVVLSISSLSPDFMKLALLPAIIPAVGCLMFSIAPLFIIRFFRGFLP